MRVCDAPICFVSLCQEVNSVNGKDGKKLNKSHQSNVTQLFSATCILKSWELLNEIIRQQDQKPKGIYFFHTACN